MSQLRVATEMYNKEMKVFALAVIQGYKLRHATACQRFDTL